MTITLKPMDFTENVFIPNTIINYDSLFIIYSLYNNSTKELTDSYSYFNFSHKKFYKHINQE
jgi:hypothetical protein